MAELCQTTGNASSSDVGEGDITAPYSYEAHSPQSNQDLHSVAPPCLYEDEESDSSVESKTSDLHPEENALGNVCRNSDEDLLSFAEVLYKCTLCTSLPSILTSKETFVAHVTQEHLTTQTRFKCGQCDLKLGTEEDLRTHIACAHCEKDTEVGDRVELCHRDMYPSSPIVEDRLPVPMTPAYPSTTPTPVRTESPNPSKKDFPCNKYQVVKPSAPVVKVNDVPKNENISKIQKLTEEIVQSQTPGTQANLMQSWSNMSSFTPEFGRYTKLIREGGNIVYFCQVCNWKCQVKAAFQAHCNGPHHNNKVRIGDQNNPHRKRGGSSGTTTAASPSHSGGSPSHSMSPGLLSIVPKPDSDNHTADTSCRVDGQFKLETSSQMNGSSPDPRLSGHMMGHNVNPCVDRKQNLSEMPFLQGLLTSQKTDTDFQGSFVFQKRSEKLDNDPVNPGLSAEAYFQKSLRNPSPSKFVEQGSTNQDNSIPRNKRKRPVPVSLRNQIESRTSWSDSDSDDCAARAKISDSSSSDGDRPADKRFKQEELSPVQRDDFHSRMMRKNLAVSTHNDRLSTSSPAGSAVPAGNVSPYLQNSFRNRLFASAFGASWGPMYGWFGQTNSPFHSAMYSNDTNGIKDKVVSDSPFENSIHYGSKLFPNAFTGFDYSGKHKQASAVLASRHDTQNSDNSSDKDDNSRNSDTASENVLKTADKHESDEPVFRCSMCEFSCQDVHSYRHHFMVDHGVEDTDGYLGDGQFSSMNEGWKMSKIRDCLAGELTVRIPGHAYPYRAYQCF